MRTKYIVLVVLQALLLVGMIGMREVWIARGTRIKLKAITKDPKDLVRGDYAKLHYDMSMFFDDKTEFKGNPGYNDDIYVSLEKGKDDLCRPLSLSVEKPASGTFIRGRVTAAGVNSRWEITIRRDDGKEIKCLQKWVSREERKAIGKTAAVCIDGEGNARDFYVENPDECHKCPQETTSTLGVLESVKEIKYRYLKVEYGIESYFVEEGTGRVIERAPRSSEVLVEISLNRKGKGLITGLFIDGKRY